jgi:hypothetical protein
MGTKDSRDKLIVRECFQWISGKMKNIWKKMMERGNEERIFAGSGAKKQGLFCRGIREISGYLPDACFNFPADRILIRASNKDLFGPPGLAGHNLQRRFGNPQAF